MEIASHDGPQDLPPIDGPEQSRRCAPSFFLAGQDLRTFNSADWRYGTEQVIPHLTREGGDFNTDLIIWNTGAQPGNYDLTAYNAMGNPLGQSFATLAGD